MEVDPSDAPEASTSTSATSSIRITPLSGSQSTSRALCHLLEFDDAKILLDCGINPRREEFTYEDWTADRREYLERLKELAPQLTLVLLSSPTIEALGLLPYLVSKLRLACPVYATFPCRELGQLTLEEWVASRSDEEARELPSPSSSSNKGKEASPEKGSPTTPTTADKKGGKGGSSQPDLLRADEVAWRVTREEIQLTFSRITPVVYSQVVRLSGRSNSPFSLLAHPAGNTLGGTLWSLRSATTDSLLYAPTFNHVKERTLDPAAFLIKGKEGRMEVNEAMRRVGILLIGAERSRTSATKAKERDKKLLDTITTTLEDMGNILVPTDTAGRFVELLVLLEQHWAFSNLSARFPLCLLSRTGEDVLFAIRRLADSFGGQLGADEAERERVLRFRNLRVFSSPEAMHARYPSDQPKLVLCAPASLSYGFSRSILASTFLSSPKALVLLTSPGAPDSLSSHLFDQWNNRQHTNSKYGSGKVGEVVDFDKQDEGAALTSKSTIRLKMRKKVVLQGEELMTYLEEQRAVKEKEQKAKAMAERNRRMMEADDANASSDSDDSSDDDDDLADKSAKKEAAEAAEADEEAGKGAGTGLGPGAYAEPGSVPSARFGRKGAMTTATGGAWDEFLDDSRGATTGGFDIYVRRSTGNDVLQPMSAPNQMQLRYRMFPFFERRRKVDGYGEAIDIEGWKTRGKAPEEIEAVLAAENGVLGKRKRQEEEEEQKQAEAPHKYIVEDLTLDLRCKVFAIDMEGKADGRALRSILPLIEPKKLVLINGDSDATEDLAAALTSPSLARKDILAPYVGEDTMIAEVTKSFSVRLDDTLMTGLALRKIEEYEVVPVKGLIGSSDESTLPVLVPGTGFEVLAPDDSPAAETQDPTTDASSNASLTPLSAPHFVGDIKLALLKSILSNKSVPVYFQKGVLICGPVKPAQAPAAASSKAAKTGSGAQKRTAKLANSRTSATPEVEDENMDTSGGRVTVRKDGTQLVLEGAPGDTFHEVRTSIYELHAVAS